MRVGVRGIEQGGAEQEGAEQEGAEQESVCIRYIDQEGVGRI